MFRVFLGLGSNLGDRLSYLTRTIAEIKAIAIVNSTSSIYETEPVGMESENFFYNMAIEIETESQPPELLRRIKNIERKIGRKSRARMSDREIDIDILL